MSKARMIEATCNVAGIVTADGVPVPEAVVMTAGRQQSSGVLIIDEDRAYYVTTNTTDIKAAIEKINAALTEIATTLTAIGAGMTGPTTAPPVTLPTAVANITAKVAELTTLKEALK